MTKGIRTGLRVAIIGEGVYPHQPGGVSLWCHQLVTGMPEHTFTVAALTVDGTERPTWAIPANLTEVVNLPLWGPRPRRRRRGPAGAFDAIHDRFLRALFQPRPGTGPGDADEAIAALHAVFGYAQLYDLGTELLSNAALDRMVRIWHEAGMDAYCGPLALYDAVAAADQLEHLLRPLSHSPLRVDVCHLAMNGLSALVAMACAWTYATPIVLSEHGVYLRERYLALAGDDASYPVQVIAMRFFRAIARAAYRMSDVLAPHSTYNRRWQLYNGAESDRIRTMYNGIDPANFPVADDEPDEPTIVFVGRIDPLKDLHTLIRAFAVVREQIPTARLRMFGPVTPANEEYHASCVRLVDSLGLADAASFEGRIPLQWDAYRAGHIVALTSVSEGFPYTVVESMATGRPPVCTNVGGVAEAVGDAGVVVQPRDHDAVADACVRLLRDADLRRQLGAQARERVLQLFTLQQWTDAYRALYAELAGDTRFVQHGPRSTVPTIATAATASAVPS